VGRRTALIAMLARRERPEALGETDAVQAAGARHMLCLIHPIDPRGNKVGGIETHVRMMVTHAPRDWQILLVGVDGRGDCRLGDIQHLIMDGRAFDYLPVLHFSDDHTRAARSIFDSLTFQFGLGLIRHFPALRRAVRAAPGATIELQRFEFAALGPLLRRPTIQVIHGEGGKDDKMDSLIKKFWFIHRLNEAIAVRLASRIICVNPNILARLEREKPGAAKRAEFMPVAVDTDVFAAADFDRSDGVFRVVFAGRFDEFKNPPLMFKTLQRIHSRLGGKFEFHYIGTSDPARYPEFELVRPFATFHGFRTSRQVAAIMKRCHAGILTSWFEGMPCYLLELLSVGRPVVAVTLPQYKLVVSEGKSGYLVERDDNDERLAETLADRLIDTWSAIRSGAMSPSAIRECAIPFSVDEQLDRHFARHRQLMAGQGA
jgi:glycosyltransferase involved in cell wall biosynthesis